MTNKDLTVHISARTVVVTLLFLALAALLFFLQDLVLILLTAIVLASAIEPAVRFFIKYKIPRVFAVLLVYVAVFLSIFGILFFFIPPVLDEAARLLGTLPQFIDSFRITNPIPGFSAEVVTRELSLREAVNELRSSLSGVSTNFIQTVSQIFGGVLSFVLILVFSFYFAVLERGVDDFLKVITPVKHQKYVVGLWRRSQEKIGKWMQGQIVLAIIVGVLTFLGLSILGVKFALLLAVLAGLFELIPVFGPILAAIPAVAIAFLTGDTTTGLLVIGLFLIIQQFENHLIYPLVVKKVVGVPPLLVILALLIGWQLAGFLGVLLSVPIAAVIQEFIADVQEDKRKQFESQETSAAEVV